MLVEEKKLRDPVLASLMVLAVLVNIGMWWASHHMQPRWPNVPPAPTQKTASLSGLGDSQFSYRLLAYPLQQYGNEGGMFMPLRNYNYERLGSWFLVLRGLDPVAQYVPYIAAYYYGATQDPSRQLGPVVEYLAVAGHDQGYEKWRWLAQAAYLSYYRQGDKKRGIEIATDLSRSPEEIPIWARQMPVILQAKMGDRETALRMMTAMLQDALKRKQDRETIFEINFIIDYICDHLQTPAEAKKNPICPLSRGY